MQVTNSITARHSTTPRLITANVVRIAADRLSFKQRRNRVQALQAGFYLDANTPMFVKLWGQYSEHVV